MKSCPWFVSDTMQHDVQYSVGKLQQSETLTQSKQGNIWATRGNDGKIIICQLIILYLLLIERDISLGHPPKTHREPVPG